MKSVKLDGKTISSEKLQEQCSSLVSHANQLGLINNYLSCLALQYVQDPNNKKGHAYILYSLFNENGLDNLMDVIVSLCESIVETSDYLCDVEGIVNERAR